ncbi:uncharacterized protein H6S33_009961 [Morchella sextelata]|uniref:uncharacterized protein n=1 Tax=Morchella sextelata TaxID=1174677 RepID=UPI001D0436FA|nr:uncharacterized protein H6S33_009961 [Morchella sextelata]KAH0611909.1 hypothetical protein H6S33_009961 [Morchella sextelata]
MPDEPGPYSPTAAPFTPSSSASASTFKGATPEIGERVNLPPSSVPCRFFLKGYCSRGSTCWYAHDVAAVPGVEDVVINTTAAVDEKGKCSASAADDKTDTEECCAICFEVPSTYGLLTNCDHVFCLSCIRSWRSSGSSNNNAPSPFPPGAPDDLHKTSKTCPLCRVRSKFIVPSSILPTAASKEIIVQRYLDKLTTIPCRYFHDSLKTRPRPFCPFGNDCHYSHDAYIFSERELASHRRSRRCRGGGGAGAIGRAQTQALIEMILEGDGVEWGAVGEGVWDVGELLGVLGEIGEEEVFFRVDDGEGRTRWMDAPQGTRARGRRMRWDGGDVEDHEDPEDLY